MEEGATGNSAHVLLVLTICIIVGPAIISRLRLPGMVGLVLAGMVLGPYVIGWLKTGQMDGLGKIGLLYLMFQAGLEVDMNMVRENRKATILFGLLTFSFPLIAGILGGFWQGFTVAAAILIGSIWASHTLVTLPDISRAGLGRNRVVTSVIGATVITDTFSLIILAVISSTQTGGSGSTVLLKLIGGLVVLVIYSMWLLPTLGRHFFMHTGRERALRFVMMLFALSSAALIAEAFGIEGLVGAFFAGLGMNRLVPNESPLMERIEFFGSALIVPAFLVYVGTQLDPSVLASGSTLILALVFILALVVGKGLAALVGGGLLHWAWAEQGLALGMTLPQAAATLASTLVGAQIGLFDAEVVNAVVLVVLVSLIAGSLVTKGFAAKTPRPVEAVQPLGRRVLVGVKAANDYRGVMHVANALALADSGTFAPTIFSSSEEEQSLEAQTMGEAAEAARAAGAETELTVRHADSLSTGILQSAADLRASAILVQRTGTPSLSDYVFGSELDRIGIGAGVPFLVGRFHTWPVKRVAFLVEPSGLSPAQLDEAGYAAQAAIRVAKSERLPLAVLTSDSTQLSAIDAGLGEKGVEVKTVSEQDIRSVRVPLARNDLVVLPSTLARKLGRVANKLLEVFPEISVLVVAGPHMFRMLPGSVRTESYLGWETGPAASLRSDHAVREAGTADEGGGGL